MTIYQFGCLFVCFFLWKFTIDCHINSSRGDRSSLVRALARPPVARDRRDGNSEQTQGRSVEQTQGRPKGAIVARIQNPIFYYKNNNDS